MAGYSSLGFAGLDAQAGEFDQHGFSSLENRDAPSRRRGTIITYFAARMSALVEVMPLGEFIPYSLGSPLMRMCKPEPALGRAL